MSTDQELLFFNGINGDDGGYEVPPMSPAELLAFIRGTEPPENLDELRYRYEQRMASHLGVREGIDPEDLAQAGWGVIFPHDADPVVKEALGALLDLRREQAGDYYRVYEGADGYRPGESKRDFLARHGAGAGPADPEKVPYYLLLVGSPEQIPYRFQSQLDVQYAVGRIHFDEPQDYANYARSVVAAETGQIRLPRRAALFGVANRDDPATQMSAQHLVDPLAGWMAERATDWEVEGYLREQAKKAQLAQLLGGEKTPALLFTASHGMGFDLGSPRQLPHQGALLCQDWPGPHTWDRAIPQDFYFAADDLESTANLGGLVAFFFACYGAGTPLRDEFAKQAFKQEREQIAPKPFLSRLPAAMLSNPAGGALAVVGHVERAWGYSFMSPAAGRQTTVFESTLQALLYGRPVGLALEYFNERYAELSTELTDELDDLDFGKTPDPYELAGMWTANNDARGYAIIGDPAVRVPVVEDEADASRPVLEPVPVIVRSRSGGQEITGEQGARSAGQESTAEHGERRGGQETSEVQGGKAVEVRSSYTVLDGLAQISRYAEPSGTAAEMEFGRLGDARDKVREVAEALTEALGNLAGELATFSKNLSSLTVETYISEDIEGVDPADIAGSGAIRRAVTRVKLDGDIQVVLPGDVETLEESLLAIHSEMVAQAQANRAEMVRIAAEALTSLVAPAQKG